MAEAVIRVTIGRKQDKVVGCFHIVVAPGKDGKYRVVYQDPIAGWRATSRRGNHAHGVWKRWRDFKHYDYRTKVTFCHDGSRPSGIQFEDIFPPRPKYSAKPKGVIVNGRRY